MESTIKKAADGTVTITTTFKPQGDLLDQETALQIELQEAGRLALVEAIKELDTNREPIVVTNERYTSRGLEKKVSNDFRIGRVIPSCISAFAGRQNVCTLRGQGTFFG
jgi:hypothetical protein